MQAPTPSTAYPVKEEGRRDGRARGRLEGACRQYRKLLLRLGKRRFGPLAPEVEAAVDRCDSRLALPACEALADRLATVADAATWVADLVLPDDAPPLPDYTADYSFDPSPPEAGFDQNAEVTFGPKSKLLPPHLRGKSNKGIVHMRFQKWYEPDLDRKIYKTNRELGEKYGVSRVESLVLLIFPMAEGPNVTGRFKPPPRLGKKHSEIFEYRLVRVWEKPPDEMIQNGLGTAMLAPLAKVTEDQLPDIIRRIDELNAKRKKTQEEWIIWDAIYWWMGYRYPADLINRLLADKIPLLRERSTYRSVLAEAFFDEKPRGEADGALAATRDLARRVAAARLGPPPAEAVAALDALTDLGALEKCVDRALDAGDWLALAGASG